jgi:hypothetical protein
MRYAYLGALWDGVNPGDHVLSSNDRTCRRRRLCSPGLAGLGDLGGARMRTADSGRSCLRSPRLWPGWGAMGSRPTMHLPACTASSPCFLLCTTEPWIGGHGRGASGPTRHGIVTILTARSGKHSALCALPTLRPSSSLYPGRSLFPCRRSMLNVPRLVGLQPKAAWEVEISFPLPSQPNMT